VLRASMAMPNRPEEKLRNSRPRHKAEARRNESAERAEADDTLRCSRRDKCCKVGDRSKTKPLGQSKENRVDWIRDRSIHAPATGQPARARARSASRIRPKPGLAPTGKMSILATTARHCLFECQHRLWSLRPWNQRGISATPR